MAFTCGFFNSVAHDRKYDAVQHGMIFDGIITDGIYATYLKAMVVKASENASEVIVQPGRAWFNHTWSYNDSDYPVAAPEPEVVLDRIDTLVLDVNSEDAVRNNQFLWVQGTPTSQTPEPPALIHTATHNQYPLCDVYRQAGTTMIYAADITNRVGTSDCPFVTGVLESIDIDDLLAQWDDEFHTWENATKASFEGWMLNQQQVYTAWFSALRTQMAGDVADVEAWVQTIKDIIDEETATHLQLEIDEINSMLPSGSHITVTTSDTELYSRTVTITDEDNNTVTSQFDANGVAVFKSVPYVGNLTITSTDGVRTATEVVNTPYFARYEFTLAFWSATVNIIGDSVFGGDTVTITDSTTALVGTVVLNASGTGVFNATYPDTYKFSVTHGGETMEVSLAVTQETTYNVEIHSGLNYQAWLNAGRVSKSFSSLDEVLADEKTLRQLFLVHDAVDYVASQRVNNDLTKIFNTYLAAKWINNSDYALEHFYAVADIKTVMDAADKYGYGEWCLMPQVPKMTYNTAPSGECFGSTKNDSGYDYYYPFKASPSAWLPNSSDTAPYIGYSFTSLTKVSKVTFTITKTNNPTAINYKIQGLNANEQWVDLTESHAFTEGSFSIDCDGSIEVSKVKIQADGRMNDGSANTYRFTVIQFYTWAPKGNVPVMTSDTAPYGSVIGSGATSGKERYKAFNGQTPDTGSNVYETQTAPSSTYIGYKFVNPVCVRKVSYVSPFGYQSGAFGIKTFVVKGSNDGSNWETLTDTINVVSQSTAEPTIANIDNNNYYLYYALFALDNWGTAKNYTQAGEIQFYGRELKVSVPTMTSNTAPFGEVSASGYYDTFYPWRAFSGSNASNSDCWYIVSSSGWLKYSFVQPIIVKQIMLQNRNHSTAASVRALKDFVIEGSNDGFTNDVHELGSYTNSNSSGSGISWYDVDNNDAYAQIRLRFTSTYGGAETAIGQLQFYGLDYSEKEFEVGTTKKWLYDHGVELETMTSKTAISGSKTEKKSDSLYMEIPATANAMAAFYHQLDLTNYNLWRFKVGENLYSAQSNINPLHFSAFTQLPSNGADTTYRIGDVAVAMGDSNAPYNGSLDVSTINQTCYLVLLVGNGSGTLVKKADVTELWLE